jgi:hypothetical protein
MQCPLSTQLLHVTALCHGEPNATPVVPASSADQNFVFNMDSAYLKHLNKELFPNKRQRRYVSKVVGLFA